MAILAFLCSFTTGALAFNDCKLFVGTIDLPAHFTKNASVRVWHGGVIIHCDVGNKSKTVSFELSVDKSQTFFYLVIVDDINPMVQDNTVKYFTIANGADYKLFSLELDIREIDGKAIHKWHTKQLHVPLTRIPDDAIIVYLPGSYVDHLEQGSSIELPKIVLKKDLQENVVHDILTQQLLKAINYDTLHATITRQVKQNPLTTLVAFNT